MLENEIENGEVAVAALQAEQESAFASLSLDREALLSKNRMLAVQMEESRRRLEATRAEAEAIIAEEQDRNDALERKHEATLAELQKIGGDAALRPMLIEAQQQLSRERERLAALRREKEALEEARVTSEAAERERAGKLELLNRSLADFEKHRERSAAELGPGFQGLDSGETESVDGSRTGDGYSDLASTTSEAHDPSDVDGKRAAARRAKAAQNKQKFEALKAQRDQYLAGLAERARRGGAHARGNADRGGAQGTGPGVAGEHVRVRMTRALNTETQTRRDALERRWTRRTERLSVRERRAIPREARRRFYKK